VERSRPRRGSFHVHFSVEEDAIEAHGCLGNVSRAGKKHGIGVVYEVIHGKGGPYP
jgi:hypothetical protein